MRLCTYQVESAAPRLGLVVEQSIVDVAETGARAGDSTLADIEALQDALVRPEAMAAMRELERMVTERAIAATSLSLDGTRLLPPVTSPGKILCVAANYKAHIEETGVITYVEKSVANPWFFLKPTTTLIGNHASIVLPRFSAKVDWELELAVVIGKGGRYIPRSAAMNHVAGYTIVNDVSAREVEVSADREVRDRDKFHDWLHGKWFDTFCPMGPYFVSSDEIQNPHALRLVLFLNGDVMQDATTGWMIFSIPELIEYASVFTSLEPGDVICTGTPSGVGKARGRFLRPGDVLTGEIEGLGTLVSDVISEEEALSNAEFGARQAIADAVLGPAAASG